MSHYDTPTSKIFKIQNMNFPCKDINFYMFHIPSLSHLLKNKLISKQLFITKL